MFTAVMSLALLAVVAATGLYFSTKMDEMTSQSAASPLQG